MSVEDKAYRPITRGDFELFRPTGRTLCTEGGEIWRGGVDAFSPNFSDTTAAKLNVGFEKVSNGHA